MGFECCSVFRVLYWLLRNSCLIDLYGFLQKVIPLHSGSREWLVFRARQTVPA